jgi:hypothetical protein
VYTPKGERAAGLIEGLKAIVAEKLRAKSTALAEQQKKQQQQRALGNGQQPGGPGGPPQLGGSSSSSSSGPSRSVRMVRG